MLAFTHPILSVRVIDGDTSECFIDLGYHITISVIVRLHGIDCPELHTPAQSNAAHNVALLVHNWCKQREGKLTLVSLELDKYGRSLGTIQDDDNQNLNQLLLQKNCAHSYNGLGQRPAWTDEELSHIESLTSL